MRSKRFLILLLIAGLTTGSLTFWHSKDTHSEGRPVHALGVVIRPVFFERVMNHFNRTKNKVDLSFCVEGLHVTTSLTVQLDSPRWRATDSNVLVLDSKIASLQADGSVYDRCPPSNGSVNLQPVGALLTRFSATIKQLPLKVWVNPKDLSVKIHRNFLADETPELSFVFDDKPKLSHFISEPAFQDSLINFFTGVVEANLGNWLKDHFRGLVQLQSVDEVMKDNPLWGKAPLINKGAITLEMAEPASSKPFTTFAFYPFASDSVFVRPDRLELYLNSSFLHVEDLQSISPSKTSNLNNLIAEAATYYAQPENWRKEKFERPYLPAADSELNLVVPTSLINEALENIYRDGLLRFRAKIDLGVQTKGIITDQSPEVLTTVNISPLVAPSITFETNRFKLEVKNYTLDIGTFIEDRTIPATKILTHASISASLRIDNEKQTVNLLLDPSTFELELQDSNGRLKPEEVQIFRDLAAGLWKDFITAYSDMVVFPAIIKTSDAPLVITGVAMNENNVLLNLNVQWEKMVK